MRWLSFGFLGLCSLPLFYRPTVILSASMEPTLAVGSLSFVQRNRVPLVGDIVFASIPAHPGEYFSHRVIGWEISSTGEVVIRTKGDGQANGDAWETPLNDVHGVIVASLPGLGRPVLLVQTIFQNIF